MVLLLTQIKTITNKIFLKTSCASSSSIYGILLSYSMSSSMYSPLLSLYVVISGLDHGMFSFEPRLANAPHGCDPRSKPASLCALRAARLGRDSDLGPITRTARFRHFSTHSRSRDVTMTRTVCQLLCVTELSTQPPLLNSAQCLISPGQYLQH